MLVPDYKSDSEEEETSPINKSEEKSEESVEEKPNAETENPDKKRKVEELSSVAEGNSATTENGLPDFSFQWEETLQTEQVQKAIKTKTAIRLDKEESEKNDEADGKPKMLPPTRAYLKARDSKLNFEQNLNKTQVVNMAGPKSDQPGFYCSVCDSLLKSSDAYLSHINGKQHQKKLGFSLRVERSSYDEVKAKLQALKDEQSGRSKEIEEEERKRKEQQAREEEEKAKEAKKAKKLEKKNKKKAEREAGENSQADDDDPDLEAMKAMGFDFTSFGSGKK